MPATIRQNKVVVCSSSGGGLLNFIAEHSSELGFTISLLIVDRICGAISVAENQRIPWKLLPLEKKLNPKKLLNEIPQGTDLIVLAGYLSKVDEQTCIAYDGKIINSHPSLLPRFGGINMYGYHVHEKVLESGTTVSGCTVHLVNSEYDEGEIVIQQEVQVFPEDTPLSLGKRVHEVEGPLLLQAIQLKLSA